MITSAQNPKIRLARGLLARRKEREEHRSFVVEGVRLSEEALASDWKPHFVLFSRPLTRRGEDLVSAFIERDVEVEEITPALMNSLSETEAPQGILAALPLPAPHLPSRLDFLLVIDALRDPGNLGTLLRSATAAGVQAALLTPGSTDPFAPKVVRAAMGAHFHLPVLTLSWPEIGALAHEKIQPALQLYLADVQGGQAGWQLDLRRPVGLVIGGEAGGASREAHCYVDGAITIPMPGRAESLNAAIAGSILLFEVVRQRSP